MCTPIQRADRGPARIGYARVSTEDQNLALQIDALKAAGCRHIYRDEGVSGIAVSRPALKKAMAAVRPGDVLVTWKLDRLGRSLVHLIEIVELLEHRGAGFRSLSEAIDTTTAGGRLIFHVMGALAEFEQSLISERTRAGMAAAKARGRRLGRPPRLSEAKKAAIKGELSRRARPPKEIAQHYGASVSTIERLRAFLKARK